MVQVKSCQKHKPGPVTTLADKMADKKSFGCSVKKQNSSFYGRNIINCNAIFSFPLLFDEEYKLDETKIVQQCFYEILLKN